MIIIGNIKLAQVWDKSFYLIEGKGGMWWGIQLNWSWNGNLVRIIGLLDVKLESASLQTRNGCRCFSQVLYRNMILGTKIELHFSWNRAKWYLLISHSNQMFLYEHVFSEGSYHEFNAYSKNINCLTVSSILFLIK